MGWFYGFMVYILKTVSFGVKTYSVLSSGTEVLMFRLLGVSCGWIYGLYSGANCFVDGRQFLLLEQATWTCYGCGLSLCNQLVRARHFLLLEQAIWS